MKVVIFPFNLTIGKFIFRQLVNKFNKFIIHSNGFYHISSTITKAKQPNAFKDGRQYFGDISAILTAFSMTLCVSYCAETHISGAIDLSLHLSRSVHT